uniref:Reverse transcriptase domain-containing protein n=1 Tax=Tanacetum cinerariifolium TaxID=118510 RepID=A0A6L2N9B7_TANCI|nr:reverse transcriptase domain-containing protein [Tanacetum cinerariifolium]
MDNKKHIVNLESFRDMLHICSRVPGQSFDEPPFEEEILAFIRFLGHSAAIRTLTDVNINKLYQPWRSFAAIINKCLTGKSSGYDSLRLSQAQILWGLYHKRNVDYAYLMWEDFVYQVEHKNQKKSNEMYYPRFTKVIIHHFMSKDPSILRRKKFGALLPIELTNDEIGNSEAYKEYYAIATGEAAPKPKANLRRTKSSSNTSITPPTAAASPRLTAFVKGKQTAKTSKAKSLSALSEVQMNELVLNQGFSMYQLMSQRKNSPGILLTTKVEGMMTRMMMKKVGMMNKNIMMKNLLKKQGMRKALILSRKPLKTRKIKAMVKRIKGMGITLEVEDSHVTLTPVNPDGQQQSSSVSSQFVTSMLNLTLDVGMEQTNQFAGAVSSILGIVNRYIDQQMNEAVKVAIQIQSDRLRDEAQRENDEFLKIVDENMKKIIKEQVKDQVKVQVSKILPMIEQAVNKQLEAQVLTRSSHSSKTSYAVAADLSEMELKKILIEKMEGNKSIQRSDEQRNLYKALVEAYEPDKIILDTYGDTVTLKRRRDDDADKDKEPSVGPDRGSKRRREDDQPIVQSSQHREWFSQQQKPPTPDRDWNKTLPTVNGSIQPWIRELAKQADSRSSFNELMDTLLNFSNFLINRLKVDTLTLELLACPTYELMKGLCKSLVELEYHLGEVFKATIDQLDWVNPEGQQYPHNLLQPLPLIPNNRGHRVIPFEHFINNDLEYLRGGASSRKYTTSITKTKATYYGHIKWIEDLVPMTMWIEAPIGYDKHALWGITVRRDDDKLYKFKEGDFKRLRIQDIEYMLLLLVQGKLTNLIVEEHFAFNVSLRMFTRSIVIQRRVEDLQLGVESYQKKLNLTEPDSYRSDLKRKEAYTAYSNPQGFIYQNKDKKNRLMRIDELHKFSDGTLTDVRTALDDRLKGIRMQYLPHTIWRKSYKDRAVAMIQAIDKRLKTRRIMRSLERNEIEYQKDRPCIQIYEDIRWLGIASDTLIDFQIKFSISIGETVTHWFTLITLSALRRSDNENTLSLMNLILRSILMDLQDTPTNPRRMTKPYSSHCFIANFLMQETLRWRVSRHIAEHKLNIREGCLPVRQKKKGQAPERNKAIYEEVEKLVDAGIMKEVHYHIWLSNPVESLCGYPFKCFLDAYKGYHQIKMAKEDEEKTSFITSQRIFCYLKMSFELKNAGATYQRLVDKAFQKQIGRNLEVYVDDLVVKSYTEQKVNRDIKETFKTLREINMKLIPKKCTFGMREGTFLGYKVNADGSKVCLDKVEAVLSFLSPKCLKDVQKRLLVDCESGGVQTNEKSIAELPMLTAPKEKEELIIYLAAAKRAISAVLMTERDGKQMPIYFVSRALRGPKTNYTPMEKLILALDTPMEDEEALLDTWILFIDGSSCIDGSRVGLIITNPEGMEFTYTLRFRFDATNNEAEYEALIAGLRITEQMGIKIFKQTWTHGLGLIKQTTSKEKFMRGHAACTLHLQANDLVERENGSLGEGIKARLDEKSKNWIEEISYVLWVQRTMIKSSNEETPFSLTYGTEAVIPVEIGMTTLRTTKVDMIKSDEALEINLDLLKEKREQAAIQKAKSKAMMEKYYNARVRSTSFKPGDLVYWSNEASHAEDEGKLKPKWE